MRHCVSPLRPLTARVPAASGTNISTHQPTNAHVSLSWRLLAGLRLLCAAAAAACPNGHGLQHSQQSRQLGADAGPVEHGCEADGKGVGGRAHRVLPQGWDSRLHQPGQGILSNRLKHSHDTSNEKQGQCFSDPLICVARQHRNCDSVLSHHCRNFALEVWWRHTCCGNLASHLWYAQRPQALHTRKAAKTAIFDATKGQPLAHVGRVKVVDAGHACVATKKPAAPHSRSKLCDVVSGASQTQARSLSLHMNAPTLSKTKFRCCCLHTCLQVPGKPPAAATLMTHLPPAVLQWRAPCRRCH